MARSVIRSDQVLDEDFVSHGEHGNPLEVPHNFLMNIDTPTTYSGSAEKYVKVNTLENAIEFVSFTGNSTYPRYYIEDNLHINVSNYGQYVVHETGYLEVAGTLELGVGAMLIIS